MRRMRWFPNDTVSFQPGFNMHLCRFCGRVPLGGLFFCSVNTFSVTFPESPNYKPTNGLSFAFRRFHKGFRWKICSRLFRINRSLGLNIACWISLVIFVEFLDGKPAKIRYALLPNMTWLACFGPLENALFLHNGSQIMSQVSNRKFEVSRVQGISFHPGTYLTAPKQVS